MQLAILVWTKSLMLMKRNIWRRWEMLTSKASLPWQGWRKNRTIHTPFTHTHTIVGYFKPYKAVIWVLSFWPLYFREQMGRNKKIRGWQGWRLGIDEQVRVLWEHSSKCQQAGQGSHLLSSLPLPLLHTFDLLSQTKPLCRQTASCIACWITL